MKKYLVIIMMLAPLALMAQSGTNSPYSQYGIGVLTDQGTGFNRAMNGVGIGFHQSNQVNYLNPASYAAIDSLTFIFDVGASVQLTNFKEGSVKKNARNANFEYAVASFRVLKNLGMGFGIVPYSNIGYSYGSTNFVDEYTKTTSNSNTYSGSGGIRNAFIGAAYSPIKGLRIGFNVGLLWGDYSKSVVSTYTDSYVNTLSRYYTSSVSSYKFDVGLQYTAKLNKKDYATIGLTYTPGHSLSGDATMRVVSKNSQTGVADSVTTQIDKGLFLPTQYGVGLAYKHGTKWNVGVDYTMQKWSEKPFPSFVGNSYQLVNGVLQDRHRVAIGGEYVNNTNSRRYLDHVHYRAGFSYATPYIKINGKDGPKEYSASVGIGLPISNAYNNRSLVNISAQYCHNAATGFITENIFRINVGITFNERWFMKWKLD